MRRPLSLAGANQREADAGGVHRAVHPPEAAVIDYGMGNLLSVRRALEHCGWTVTVTADRDAILSAPRVVLPGVGAFADGMAELRRQGLDAVVRAVAAKGIPLLGICGRA